MASRMAMSRFRLRAITEDGLRNRLFHTPPSALALWRRRGLMRRRALFCPPCLASGRLEKSGPVDLP